MKILKHTLFTLIVSLAFMGLSVSLFSDTVQTTDGATLVGKIIKIDGGVVHLETSYAGTLQIKQSAVVGFSTDNPVFVRLSSGNTMNGKVEMSADKNMKIKNEDGVMTTTAAKVTSTWSVGETDPQVKKLQAEKEAMKRKWKYQAAVDITGKSGNTDESGTAIGFNADLVGPRDALKFYLSLNTAEKNGDKTSEEIIGGVDYSAFFKPHYGWFVREELETDDFEDLELRSTTAAGLKYKFIDETDLSLVGRAGFSYVFESTYDREEVVVGGETLLLRNGLTSTSESPGLDLGLNHRWKFAKWGTMTNALTYTPKFEDLGDYLVKQDSALEMPLGLSDFWKIRIGYSNSYKSIPAAGRVNRDSTYYTRLILNWQ